MNVLKGLIFALILAVLGIAGFAWTTNAKKQALEAQLADIEADHKAALQEKSAELQRTLAAQNDQHQQAIQALNEEFEQKLDAFREQQREKMADAYTEFENIFEGNKKTIDYINLLEGKVKAGQALSKAEVEKMAVITTGLGYLQKQYPKPLQEFKELETYFATQASRLPEKPSSRFGFFKRTFSKKYREAEREFYREQGAQEAMEEAQGKFGTVYSTAQRSMAAVNLNADAQVKKLYDLMQEKDQANQQDLSELFSKARQALQTHQDVLDFEPDNLPEAPNTPRP